MHPFADVYTYSRVAADRPLPPRWSCLNSHEWRLVQAIPQGPSAFKRWCFVVEVPPIEDEYNHEWLMAVRDGSD